MKLRPVPWIIVIAWAFSLEGHQSLQAQNSPQAKWTETGRLLEGRTYNTATLLPNGQILIVGGHGVSVDLASTELYKTNEGVFVPAKELSPGRECHTSTLLPNGQVLVVGGLSNGKILANAELYNPTTNTWTPTANLHVARACHTATLLPSGQVLIAGGTHNPFPPVFVQGAPPGSAMDLAELFDPATGKWTVVDNLHAARYVHTAILLKNGQVLVVGGLGDGGVGNPLASAEIFNPVTKSWKEVGSMHTARFDHSAALLPNGKVLVSGGQANGVLFTSTEVYDPAAGNWMPSGNFEIANGALTVLKSGLVLASGGVTNSGVVKNSELYDPSMGTWSATASLNTARMIPSPTLLPDGRVLVAGGNDGSGTPAGVIASAELYDPAPPLAQRPPPEEPTIPSSTPASSLSSTTPPLLTFAAGLVIVTACVVILTACVVILLCAWLVFVLVRRWRK